MIRYGALLFWTAGAAFFYGVAIGSTRIVLTALAVLAFSVWMLDEGTRSRNRESSRELRANEARARENGKPNGSLDMIQHVAGRER